MSFFSLVFREWLDLHFPPPWHGLNHSSFPGSATKNAIDIMSTASMKLQCINLKAETVFVVAATNLDCD
jgi:hypothetical protein